MDEDVRYGDDRQMGSDAGGMARRGTRVGRGGYLRVPRSKGAITGALLILLGVWGAIIPFIGPYFNFGYTPNDTWTWTSGRFWLEVLPGAVTIVGGFLLMTTANRAVAHFGAWIAAAAGAWFVVGPVIGQLWNGPEGAAGVPVGGTSRQVAAQLSFFHGLGVVILFLAALALGRFMVRSVRDMRAADRHREAAMVDRGPRVDEGTTYPPVAGEAAPYPEETPAEEPTVRARTSRGAHRAP